MRVLALGGCGEMGRHAVRTLTTLGTCESLVIADIDEARARQEAERCGPAASWIQVDVSSRASLLQALEGVDIVMNTVGPFYRFGVGVLAACIERGLHYVDINDDWEPTLDMLALHERARERGVTALIGMGASPGVSNLLAVTAMAELDTAEEIYTGWDLVSAKPEKVGRRPSAATVHGIHQLTGRIRIFRGGRLVDTAPMSEVKLDYPGVGRRSAWTIGHPEAVTLPRYFPSLRASANVMVTSRANIFLARLLTGCVNAGVLAVEKAAWLVERLEGPGRSARTPEEPLTWRSEARTRELPLLFALAVGKKDGRVAGVGCTVLSAPPGGMGGATGIPLALGVHLLAKGRIAERGVFAPEAVVPPRDFFESLAPLCAPGKKGLEDLIFTTHSWTDEPPVSP